MAERLGDAVADARLANLLSIDGALTAGGARPELLQAIEGAGPFGTGCPEPVFAFPRHRVVDVAEVGSGGHVRVRLRAAGQPLGFALRRALGAELHVAATLSCDRWGGGERVDLRVVDVAAPG